MSYAIGTAVNFLELKNALLGFAQAAGWTASGDTLSRGGVTLSLSTVTERNKPGLVARYDSTQHYLGIIDIPGNFPVTFPLTYHIFAPDDGAEVYCIVNYDTAYFQHLHFGISPVPGLPGSGFWMYGSQNDIYRWSPYLGIWSENTVLPFLCANNLTYDKVNSRIAHGFTDGGTPNTNPLYPNAELIMANAWNGEAILLPIQILVPRTSGYYSLAGELKHCRYINIHNYNPLDVITLGTDRWKLMPGFKKGGDWKQGYNQDIAGSGDYALAIRYDGD